MKKIFLCIPLVSKLDRSIQIQITTEELPFQNLKY